MFGAAGCRNIPRCNGGSTSVCQPSRGKKQTRAFFNHIIKSSQPVMLSGAIFCHLSHSRFPPWPNWPLAAVPRWCGHKDAAGRHTCQIPHQDNIHSAAVRTDFWIITDRARLSPSGPSTPPEKLQLNALDSSSVLVSWRPPLEPNGIIIGYFILYSGNLSQPDDLWEKLSQDGECQLPSHCTGTSH